MQSHPPTKRLKTDPVRCETLRQVREGKHLSQVALMYASSVHSGYISAFENGYKYPWPRARRSLAAALEVPSEKLFPEYFSQFDPL